MNSINNKISKITKIFIKKEEEEKKSDQEKFEKLLEILKLDVIPSALDNLSKYFFHQYIRDIFDQYEIFLTHPDKFFRKKLRKRFEKFNKSFNELNYFLALNFFYKSNGIYEINKYEEDYEGREEVLNSLIIIKDKTKKDYIDLVRIGKEKYIGFWDFLHVFLIIILILFDLFIFNNLSN